MDIWNTNLYEQLSIKVANKFKLQSHTFDDRSHGGGPPTWLYEKWDVIMELCIQCDIYAYHSHPSHPNPFCHAFTDIQDASNCAFRQDYSSHVGDIQQRKSLAERVARMLALLEVK